MSNGTKSNNKARTFLVNCFVSLVLSALFQLDLDTKMLTKAMILLNRLTIQLVVMAVVIRMTIMQTGDLIGCKN